MKISLAERVAIALMTLSLGLGGVLAVTTVRTFSQPGTTYVGAGGGLPGSASGAALSGGVAGAAGSAGGSGGGAFGGGGGTGSGSSADATGGGGGGTGGAITVAGAKVTTDQGRSGVSKDAIKVGGFFDMTGAVDSSVERDTVKAYLRKVNDAGGVNGRKFQYFDCDSKYDVAAAHSCATQLIQDQVLAVVGWTAPQGEDGEVPDFNQAGIPVIGGLGTPNEFKYPLSYPVSISFEHYGDMLGRQAAALGIKRPSVVVITDIGWVAPVEKHLLDALKANGVTPADVEEAISTAPNYDQYVLGAKAGAGKNASCSGCAPSQRCGPTDGVNCPDGVIAALDPNSWVKLMQSMNRAQFKPPKGILGAGLDKGVFQGSYLASGELQGAHSLAPFLSPYAYPDNATVADYKNTVRQYYPSQVDNLDIYCQHAWTAAMIFVEAVRKAGNNLSRASLVQALNGIQNYDTGWSRPISYGAGLHDPNRCVRYLAYQDGWKNTSDWICV